MTAYERALKRLRDAPARWLVTGAAGFIGSNLVELLLKQGQHVIGLDNLSTGHSHNLEDVLRVVGRDAAERFSFTLGDIRHPNTCRGACEGVTYVLHQAALGSVPRSLEDPAATNASNIDGTLNMLVAARDAGVRRFVYAGSSSTYGDEPALPKVEDRIGRPLSPYAVTKYVSELYAGVFQRQYGLEVVGLRYFNVFGRRQDPDGAYAAVIPRWIGQLLAGETCVINGDGQTSRDFCYIDNVLQANILAAVTEDETVTDQVYNVAVGDRTTLDELYAAIRDELAQRRPGLAGREAQHAEFRPGDVRHSQADISKIRDALGYAPTHAMRDGLREALGWYVEHVPTRTRVKRTSGTSSRRTDAA